MSRPLLGLYHRLPVGARSVAVSLRGLYLASWRYGRETDRLAQEALDRETWSADRLRQWQEERLAFVLHRAATRVPYYRDQWRERRRRGDRSSWQVLENWPVLEKEPLRAHPRAFLADDRDPRRMFREQTSGTTGTPLTLWWSRDTVRRWYALMEARWRGWYGVSRGDRWGMLGGQLVVPVAQVRPPFWVWNRPLRQLYLSSYHMSPERLPAYLEALRRYRVRYLLGYTSSLAALAAAVRGAADAPELEVVVTNAEPVTDVQRRRIARAFGCPVRETYGLAEIVAAAGECGEGALHLWPEAGRVEVLVGDRPVGPGRSGDLVATGLLNADMPLIRYRTGDRAALAAATPACGCGRALRRLAALEGRRDEVLYTRDGRPIGRLDPVFKADLPVREAQIIQESLDRVRLRLVPTEGFNPEHARDLAIRLRDRMGDVAVDVEQVESIPRGANGKFRAVVSRLSTDERGGTA